MPRGLVPRVRRGKPAAGVACRAPVTSACSLGVGKGKHPPLEKHWSFVFGIYLILRPDELIVTAHHEYFATVDMITSFSPKGVVLPLLADYSHIGHVSLDLSRHGRKNDQAGSNLPLISAADHDTTGRHFCAAWQLHRLVHHMDPCGDLS